MMTFHAALDIFNKIDFHLSTEKVNIRELWNRILCEDIYSDINMPPFDKSAVDGYACRRDDLKKSLKIIGTLYAGSSEKYSVEPGTCVKIMTGAPVPKGADMVIMNEHTENKDAHQIQFTGTASKSNICKLGEDVRTKDKLLDSGSLLLPHHIAVLASAGCVQVHVSKLPRIAILSTGNELVEPAQVPGRSKIRNSNAYNLISQLKSMGINAQYHGIAPDNKNIIRKHLADLFENNDLIILTGGASQGEHDFIPTILGEMAFEIKFDRIAIQPGKPISFAVRKDKFCFGLSGNPVSSFLQFELLVKPFIYHIMSHSYQHPIVLSEVAVSKQRKKADRLQFFPVSFNNNGQAEEVQFNGSAHIAGLAYADGFALFPKDCLVLTTGDKIEVLLIR